MASEPVPREASPAALDAAERALAEKYPTASRIAVVEELEALFRHYPDWDKFAAADDERFMRDWLADLGDLPLALVHSACARWRGSDAKRRPTPGQLKALVQPELDALNLFRARIKAARERLAERARNRLPTDPEAAARQLGWQSAAHRQQDIEALERSIRRGRA